MTGKISLAWLLAAGICLSSCGGTNTTQYRDPVPGSPGGLDYPDPNLFTQGVAINPLIPRLDRGTPTNYSVEPELPPGLRIDGVTGVISGTPSAPRAQTTYRVTAANPSGRSQFGVRITVHGRFTVGGVVTGLAGTGLVLSNDGENLAVNANGTFAFTRVFPAGAGFVVTVNTQPAGQTCGVSQGSGFITNVDYGEVVVSCANNVSKAMRYSATWNDFAVVSRAEIPYLTCFYPPSPETIRGHVVDPVTGVVTLLGELIYDTDPEGPRPSGCGPGLVKLDSSNNWAYVQNAETQALHVYSTRIVPSL